MQEESSPTLDPETLATPTGDIHPGNDPVPVSTVVQWYRDGLVYAIRVRSIILQNTRTVAINNVHDLLLQAHCPKNEPHHDKPALAYMRKTKTQKAARLPRSYQHLFFLHR